MEKADVEWRLTIDWRLNFNTAPLTAGIVQKSTVHGLGDFGQNASDWDSGKGAINPKEHLCLGSER